MVSCFVRHLRGNAVAYVALFTALGGTSYAAVNLAPGSVTARTLANGAVTHTKLAAGSVGTSNIRSKSLTAADLRPGLTKALKGPKGTTGPAGPRGPAGHDGSASIAASIRGTGTVTAPHQASTNVPLAGASWTQAANSLDLITGSMTVQIPASCTGSFGNSLVVSVDGTPETIGVVPSAPASTTQTIPFAVSEIMEPAADTQHTMKAALANTCTKSGEDFTVSNVKIDVASFH